MGSTLRANPPCLALPSGDMRSCSVYRLCSVSIEIANRPEFFPVTRAEHSRPCTLWSEWHEWPCASSAAVLCSYVTMRILGLPAKDEVCKDAQQWVRSCTAV